MIWPRAAAVGGVGYGPLPWATDGFVGYESTELPIESVVVDLDSDFAVVRLVVCHASVDPSVSAAVLCSATDESTVASVRDWARVIVSPAAATNSPTVDKTEKRNPT